MDRNTCTALGLMVGVGLLAVPHLSHAAAASAVLGPVSTIITAFVGLANLVAVLGVVYGGVKTINSVWSERQDGNWIWYGVGTLCVAAIAFVIIPLVIGPGIAAGATLDEVQPVMDLYEGLL
jgi:hypothetical protein